MTDADGCVEKHIEYGDGKQLKAITHGDETRFSAEYMPTEEMREAAEELDAADDSDRCHDCNAREGEYHHPRCDWEECPRCNGQLLGCHCPPPIHHVQTNDQS